MTGKGDNLKRKIMISPKAEIHPNARIGKNVTIYPFAYIEENVEIGDDCVIYPYVSIMNGTKLGRGNKVFQNTVLGAEPQDFCYCGENSQLIIGENNIIRENVVINRATHCDGNTSIGNSNFIMEGVHISHDTKIGNACVLGYGTKIAGDCVIEDGVIFSSGVIANPGARVGTSSMVQSGCRFSKDIPPYIVASNNPIGYGGVNATILKSHDVSEKIISHISNAYRLIFHGQTSIFDAVIQVEEQVPDGTEIRNIINFIRNTKLGIIGKM